MTPEQPAEETDVDGTVLARSQRCQGRQRMIPWFQGLLDNRESQQSLPLQVMRSSFHARFLPAL